MKGIPVFFRPEGFSVTTPATVLEGVPGPLIPGTCHEAVLAGVRTRYWQYGLGMNTGVFYSKDFPKVLMVHGFRGDHHGLEIIANRLLALMPGADVISPDLPGFGRSDELSGQVSIESYVQWLHALIERVASGQKVLLVGHSFGSIVAAAYAAAHPETLDRL